MRILVIESDAVSLKAIELALIAEGMRTYSTDLGEEGIDLARLYDYDAIVLSIELADTSGFEVIRATRLAKVPTPIIALSTHDNVESKVRAIGLGADDYLTKPFHKDELVARIHAVVRRSKGHAGSVIEVGDLRVNIDLQHVEIAGRKLHLTHKEYQIVELLALRKNTTVTKERILDGLYGGRDEPMMKTVDVFACKIRKKFGVYSTLLQTVWGRGYSLVDPEVVPAEHLAGGTQIAAEAA